MLGKRTYVSHLIILLLVNTGKQVTSYTNGLFCRQTFADECLGLQFRRLFGDPDILTPNPQTVLAFPNKQLSCGFPNVSRLLAENLKLANS